MQKLKRIKTTLFLPLLFLMVLAFGMLPANQLQVKATTYYCTVKEVTVKIQDLAGNPVSGGNFNFSGIVHDPGNQAGISIAGGNVAYVSDRTVGYTNTNGTVTLKVTIWYSSPNGAVYPQYTGEVSAYSYDTSGILDEFVLPSDSITFTAKDSPTIKLVRKNVGLTVNLKDSSGNEVTGATVTINGQSAQGSGNTFTGLQEGKKYTITVQGDGYNYSTEYTVAKNGQKSRSTDLNVGARTFTLTADVLLGGKTYTGATIYVGGSNQLYWNGSTYSASLPASIYTLTSSSGSGVSITPDNELKSVSLASGDQHITYTATLNTPTIQSYNASAISSLSLNYGGSAYLTPGSTVTGASYTWTSSDSDIFSVSGNAFMGIVTANKVGTANLTLTCSYGTASKSVSIPVTVTKAATASPDAPTPSAADTDITTETFTLPSDLKNATGLTITASLPNGSSKEQSYTLNGQTSVNFSTGSTLQGQVTYNFVYTSDIYDYNTAAASQGKAYYVTKPLSVALYKGDQALTSSASSYTVTYGDTVNIRGTAGTAASNTFTLTSSDSAVIESPGSYTLGTALNAKKAGTVTLTLTRVKDSTAYWAEASASMAITVEPKSLNILEAVFTGSRDYDGTQYITATAVLPGVGNETVTITANLLLSSADADTYNTASIASA